MRLVGAYFLVAVVLANSNSRNNIRFDENVLFWISSKYQECLKSRLPCDCVKNDDLIMIAYDTGLECFWVVDNKGNKECFEGRRVNATTINVYEGRESTQPMYKFINKGNGKSNLIRATEIQVFEVLNGYGETRDVLRILGMVNMKMLKERIDENTFNFDSLLKIVSNSRFMCNEELGGINVIARRGDCSNAWIVETKVDHLVIDRFVNSCDGKSIPIAVRRESMYTVRIKED